MSMKGKCAVIQRKGNEKKLALSLDFSRQRQYPFLFAFACSDLKPQFSKNIYKVNNTERIAPAWITWILIMNQFVVLVIY